MVKSFNNYNQISKIFKEHPSDSNIIPVLESLIAVYKKEQSDDMQMPLTIFSDKRLGVLEAATKYLKENQSMKYHDIAEHLNRDERTIWVSYNNAVKKRKDRFEVDNAEQTSVTTYHVPCNIFSDRNLGPLESLVVYLKDNLNLSFQEMARLLGRTYMAVYLSYGNGKNKQQKNIRIKHVSNEKSKDTSNNKIRQLMTGKTTKQITAA